MSAFQSGAAAALDAPVGQTFAVEMVGDAPSNAVALNSTWFNAAQIIGPAVAGLLIAGIGIGWALIRSGLSVAKHFGPRWSLGISAWADLAAALIAMLSLLRRMESGIVE